jgi:hypothetical protein
MLNMICKCPHCGWVHAGRVVSDAAWWASGGGETTCFRCGADASDFVRADHSAAPLGATLQGVLLRPDFLDDADLLPAAVFVDLEASGLGPHSYPVEIGWSGRWGGSVLIAHEPWLASADGWDAAAEAVHGLSKARLRAEGRPAAEAAAAALPNLGGRLLLSDCPGVDAPWLGMLMAAAGQSGRLLVADAAEAFRAALGPGADTRVAAAKRAGHVHRAAADAAVLSALWDDCVAERGAAACNAALVGAAKAALSAAEGRGA